MADTTQDRIPPQAEKFFNKGFAAFERGNLDIAIDLLLRSVTETPGFIRARRFLRAAQIQRLRKQGKSGLMRTLADLSGLPLLLRAQMQVKTRKLDDALLSAEKLLAINPLNRHFVQLYTRIADAAGQSEAALLTLEAVVEAMPADMDMVKALGDAYAHAGEYGKARDCYSRFVSARPTDPDGLKLLKDAEAHHSMRSAGWEEAAGKAGGYKDLLKDSELANKLDMQAKAVIAGNDFESLVADARAKIAAEPRNLNYFRGLARLYLQQKRFADAIQVFEEARVINPADPELDRNLAQAKIQQYAANVADLRAKGQAAAADQLEAECTQFVFSDLISRVERYPNDLRLRYELGLQYFEGGQIDEAIQQFQIAQRSPKERGDALYYLARCFRAKGQMDMAIMQLETAAEQLPVMDDNRKKVLFELGEICELSGKPDRAFSCFKEVYGADIGYRDIGQKMERFYKARPPQT